MQSRTKRYVFKRVLLKGSELSSKFGCKETLQLAAAKPVTVPTGASRYQGTAR